LRECSPPRKIDQAVNAITDVLNTFAVRSRLLSGRFADADTDADADAGDGTDGTDKVRANLSTSIEAKPVKMMILQDISMSMRQIPGSTEQNDFDNKWTQAQTALSA
jgi:hypothetical protein